MKPLQIHFSSELRESTKLSTGEETAVEDFDFNACLQDEDEHDCTFEISSAHVV
jgi:hypothetical protein